MKINSKRLVRWAYFTAIALLLSLFENMLPPLLSFAPGVKMGLANAATLLAIIILGYADAYIVLIARCILMAIFGGNVTALLYSLPAGIISLTIQVILYHFLTRWLSIMSISFIGAVMHNIVQLFVASVIVKSNLMAMLPLIIGASTIAGIFVGLATYFVIKFLPQQFYLNHKSIRVKENNL